MSGRILGFILLFGGMFIPLLGFPVFISNPLNRSIFPTLIVIMIASISIGLVLLIANQPKPNPKRTKFIDSKYPCPVCKGNDFTWEVTPSLRFRRRIGAGILVWGRECKDCGNVQHFTDMTKTD